MCDLPFSPDISTSEKEILLPFSYSHDKDIRVVSI